MNLIKGSEFRCLFSYPYGVYKTEQMCYNLFVARERGVKTTGMAWGEPCKRGIANTMKGNKK